jgi:hypothetical protein
LGGTSGSRKKKSWIIFSKNIPDAALFEVDMDVVYVFKQTKQDFDLELLYSLRSVNKNLKNFGTIWVVGDFPRITGCGVAFKHIPAPDPFKTSQHNVRSKLQLAIQDTRVSDRFILMNDDFYFLSEIEAEAIPYLRQGMIAQHIEWREEQVESPYVQALISTKDALEKQSLPTVDFEVHAPIRLEKEPLDKVLSDRFFDWEHAKCGMVYRSLYGNLLKYPGERCMDLKIDSPLSAKELIRCFQSCRFLSTGQGGMNQAMAFQLAEAFPAC